MKRLDQLGISPTPWTSGTNSCFATLLDGYEGKCIYANGDANDVPYVGFANVVDGDTVSAIRNARLMSAAPDLYNELYWCVKWCEAHLTHAYGVGYERVQAAKAALAKASGEEVAP